MAINIPEKKTGDQLTASEFNELVNESRKIDTKVDKETGKGLSTNDYTDSDKQGLSGIKDRVGKLETSMNAGKQTLSGVQVRVEKLETAMENGGQTLSTLDSRVDELEASMAGMTGILISGNETRVGSYSFDGRENDIHSRTVELLDPPVVAGTEKVYTVSDSPLGNNMYLNAKNITVKTPDGKFYPGAIEVKQAWVTEDLETGLTVSCKTTIPAGATLMLTLEYVKLEGEVIEFSFELPEGVDASTVKLDFAPLKYDKHMAFTYTADDSVVGAWARIWRRINKKWIDDIEFFHKGVTPTTGSIPAFPLVYTDGCGNDRRFGFSVALWPTWGNEYSPDGMIKDSATSTSNPYISWSELEDIVDFGSSMIYHNVDERVHDKTNPGDIVKGFQEDHGRVLQKLGRRMKIMGLPDGNASYVKAAESSPLVEFSRSSLSSEKIYLKETGSLKKKMTRGGIGSSDNAVKLEELAGQHASETPYWVGMTTHRVDLSRIELLETVYTLYGKGGDDSIWVASWDEVYEYIQMRLFSVTRKTVHDNTVNFKIMIPFTKNYYFKDVSLLLSGVTTLDGLTVSGNVLGYSHASRGTGALLNVNFNTLLLELAEKYTVKFERSGLDEDKEDAFYFVNQLRDDLRTPLVNRLTVNDKPPVLNLVMINSGASTTYDREVSVYMDVTGTITAYRIGEQVDLSGKEWISGSSRTVQFELSAGYALKTVHVQVRNSNGESSTLSAGISLEERPAMTYTVEGKSNDVNLGVVTPASQEVAAGGQATVMAVAADGCVIGGWNGASGTGVDETSGSATVMDVQENKVITCNFREEIIPPVAGNKAIVSFGWNYSSDVSTNSTRYDATLKATKVRFGNTPGEIVFKIYDTGGVEFGTFTRASGYKDGNPAQNGNSTGDNSGVLPDEILVKNVYKGNSTELAGMTFSLPAGTYKFGLFINTIIKMNPSKATYSLEHAGVTNNFAMKTSYLDNFNSLEELTLDVSGDVKFTMSTTDTANALLVVNAIIIEKIN